MAKGAQKIAADIRRRFIPKYDPLLKEILERVEQHARQADEAEAILQRIVAALGPASWTNEDRFDMLPKDRRFEARTDYGYQTKPWAKITVSTYLERVDLEIHDCPPDLAVKICELIREEGERGKQDES
jgi:hypothetical protein